ncbi:MAG TPA: HIRAN domain-containing protein [Candidatus Hydrogenedentes bacterium]|nr:HIRAN domain-containing protein [Candidatus Hydrogenedentota bacterium]
MVKTTSENEVLLGEITVTLAGTQYCDAAAEAGDKVHFEREPDNTHDRNAIRVENGDFAKIGYVPRQTAAWLTPLIDQGLVYVDGTIAVSPETLVPATKLVLSLYVFPKNAAFLEEARDPETLPQAMHRVVLDAYNNMHDWRRPAIIRETAQRLGELSRRDVLPETRMLLALMPGFADSLDAHADVSAVNAARAALAGLRIGKALHYRNATVFPLHLENGHERAYVLLDEALQAGTAEVTETSEHGSVPEVLVKNRGELPLLLPEGEILTGAKQNRVINITILVAAHSELVIPVSCVEQGRWSTVSERFRATHYATPKVRARKCEQVWAGAARSGDFSGDQGAVWEDVATELRFAKADSRTSSLTDGIEASRGKLEDYRENLALPEDAAGVALARGSEVVLLELFDSHRTMQRLWPRLSEACFFTFAHNENAEKPTPERVVQEFLGRVHGNLEVLTETRGLGVSVGLGGGKLSGTGLCHDGRLLHLAAFPVET